MATCAALTLVKYNLLFLLFSALPALAQDPIDGAFLSRATRQDGQSLRLCLYTGTASESLDRHAAQRLADTLLVDLEIVEKTSATQVAGLDFIPVAFEQLLIWLTNDCVGFLGVEHSSYVYPEWMMTSAPYAAEPYVLIGEDLSNLGPESLIVTQAGSQGDASLAIALREAGAFGGARRIPLPTTLRQIDYLREGKAQAAVIWRPWLDELDIAGEFEVLLLEDQPFRTRTLGIAFESRQSYWRSLIDEAISLKIEK